MKQSREIQWKLYSGALVPASAPHFEIDISRKQALKLLKEFGAYFIRWTSEFDNVKYKDFWYVIKDSPPSMEELSSNTRSKVRRGLKRNKVVPISANELLEKGGYAVYKRAAEGYSGPVQPVSESAYTQNINNLPPDQYHFWGVFDKKQQILVGYCQNRIYDNAACDYTTIKFDPRFLKNYLSYALFYELNDYYLNREGYKYVNDGARSLAHQTNIQPFLIDKFKFRKAHCKLNVVYRPYLKFIVNLTYPFRTCFKHIPWSLSQKVYTLLSHEHIVRSQRKLNS